MGSTFGRGATDDARLCLSNGGTSVFLDVLALAACDLARTDFERGFALLCCNSRLGMGNDDFDLEELPWSKDDWPAERAFLLKVVALARQGHRWDLLGYHPPYAAGYLDQYEQLIAGYIPTWPPSRPAARWTVNPPAQALSRCPDHGLYLGDYTDCRLCPDSPSAR